MTTKAGLQTGGIFVLYGLLFFAACSTAPKNPGDVYDTRKTAESQLELANKEADRGNYETSLLMLNEGRRHAISADDQSLRIRVGLSRGNVLFALGRGEEASSDWEKALAEAEQWGKAELISISRIHLARGKLLAAMAEGTGNVSATAQSVKDEVSREMTVVKDRLYTAFAWLVIGISEKELGHYREAEAAVKRGLDIHEKDLYLEQAAYDWYLIASFRSLSGNYDEAKRALESAINFDRRVENSYGLATDWRAMGDVLKKAGKSGEAGEAYLRSAEIFRSMGSNADADAVEKR